MSRCARCDQEVTSGYVICNRCYKRMEGIKEAAIMQEEYQHLVERLRNRSLYKDKATLEIMDLCMEAATVITDLLARTDAAESKAEKAERERDAAVKMLRKIEWCNGCKNFRGLQGCRIGALVTCNPQNDMYVFGEGEE